MRICLVTPAAARTYHGNRVTAQRWASILHELGHDVEVVQTYRNQPADLLIALHARRSADSVRRYRARHPHRPVVLALTGTDLYPALVPDDRPVLDLADRLVVLQPLAVEQLPEALRDRALVIRQSAPAIEHPAAGVADHFDVALLAHLRAVKDPLLAAAATRLLPGTSRVHVRHAGTAIDPELAEQAARESRDNPRYHWLGEIPRPDALRLLAGSRLLLLTSRHEGGANAVSEALAAGVPILATRIPGTVGILGTDYPGYFPVGDPATLARLLRHAEAHPAFVDELREHSARLRPLTDPDRERQSWQRLLAGLSPTLPQHH